MTLPSPQKNPPNFFPTFPPHARLVRPSVPNGWPELTEFWPAEGGEFWRTGTVPGRQKLGDCGDPGKNLPEPETAGPRQHGGVVKTPVLTRPDHGWTVLRPGADRARAGSVGGSAEPDDTARDCFNLPPERRPSCARKAHLSLTGGARVTRAKPLLPSTTGLSPAPHESGPDPDKTTAPRLPPKCFARGVLVWREVPTLSSSSGLTRGSIP